MSEAKDQIETVTITVDGEEMQAPKGAMLIEVTDAHNIKVPRFCYHKNWLSLPTAACAWSR